MNSLSMRWVPPGCTAHSKECAPTSVAPAWSKHLALQTSSMRALVAGTLAPGSPACTVDFMGMVDRSKPVSRATSARRRA